jgi:site-specific recombinase XerD
MKAPELSPWLQRFFQDHLVSQRNLSAATLAAYRDTFRLLVGYLQKGHRTRRGPLLLAQLTANSVLGFLQHLEQTRHNSARTRNARLAAVRSFVHYLSDWLGPELPPSLAHILAIPFKRHVRKLVGFLNRQEIEALSGAAEGTWTGQRDHLLFLLLYNTGARISEALALRAKDVNFQDRHIQLLGKGRKERRVPLWPQTQKRLRRWLRDNRLAPESPLLPNRFGQPLTRAGAAYQLRRLVKRASARVPTLKERPISPHSFRHATAMALLEAGVPAEVMALYLGHESPTTTHLYVEASLALKQQVLMKLNPPRARRPSFRPTTDDFRFLDAL